MLLYDIPEPDPVPEPVPSLPLTVDGTSELLGCYPFGVNEQILTHGPLRRWGKMTNEVGIGLV